MKRILLIHSSSELYGSDQALLNIINAINKQKFEIYVILPSEGPLIKKIKQNKDVKVTIYPIAVLRRKNLSIKGAFEYVRNFVKSYCFLRTYMKKNKIDLVYTNTSVVIGGAVAAKHSKIKNIWQVREIISNKWENTIISFFINRYANTIIANSNQTAQSLKVSPDKIQIVYDAIPDKNNKKKSKMNSRTLTIGMAGRINKRKGHKLFVDMAENIHKKYPNVTFKIAGEAFSGEEYLEEDLKKYIKDKKLSKCVILLGQVDDMEKFYNSLDIFVSPSTLPESFGLVIVEAMAMGIPVVATNHGGPTEIIKNGEDGFLVDYNDCKELSKRVLQLIENKDLRNKFSLAGIEKKQNFFSIETMIKQLEYIFLEQLESENIKHRK